MSDGRTSFRIRDLRGLDDYRVVVDLERAIWGYTDMADVVTVPVFIITVKRGGILIGAFDEAGEVAGFAYSIVGMKDGQPMQWSHMMGVLPKHRRSGLGLLLKRAQRERALAAGFTLMEWTFDPLQALNAHLNFARLGVVCDEYAENLYGDSTSTLHSGTPTDRFIVQWNLDAPHVERRLARDEGLAMRASVAASAPAANDTTETGSWRSPACTNLGLEDARVWVEIPARFTELQQEAPALALDWRLQTRAIFQTYFGRGYRAVDFEFERDSGRGRYLLARP